MNSLLRRLGHIDLSENSKIFGFHRTVAAVGNPTRFNRVLCDRECVSRRGCISLSLSGSEHEPERRGFLDTLGHSSLKSSNDSEPEPPPQEKWKKDELGAVCLDPLLVGDGMC